MDAGGFLLGVAVMVGDGQLQAVSAPAMLGNAWICSGSDAKPEGGHAKCDAPK